MAHVNFTQNLQRHVPCPPRDIHGSTVREVLEGYFAGEPRVRGYVLDEQGALRRHVVIFVNGQQLKDRKDLGEAVGDDASVYVMQALSGG
jgi:molybdopterin synthase sulfur carrier subunit